MKTTEEWFNQLHEDYRDRALKNMIDPKAEHFSLAGAISNGFVWDNTPEGKDYWNGVFRELMYGEKFDPISLIETESLVDNKEVQTKYVLTEEIKAEKEVLTIEEPKITSKSDDDFLFDTPDSDKGGNTLDLFAKYKQQKEEVK